eukprot:8404871-Pyramimonas_sp.AAC.1
MCRSGLQNLRSLDPSVITRELRQLHLRWFHAKEPQMILVSTKAGLDNVRLNRIKGVCDTCRGCRAWGKPGRAVMPPTALPGNINGKNIEYDLMLYKQEHRTWHIINRCVRSGAGIEIPYKIMTSTLDAYHQYWMQIGPAIVLYSDGEGALNDDTAKAVLQ